MFADKVKVFNKVLRQLSQDYPDLFKKGQATPLAVGFRNQLIDRYKDKFSADQIQVFCRFWVHRQAYYRAMIEGDFRFNLDGTTEPILDAHKAHSQEQLAKLQEKQSSKN